MKISGRSEVVEASGAPCRQRETEAAVLDDEMLAASSTAVNASARTATDATAVR
jgi:hypothetical protein